MHPVLRKQLDAQREQMTRKNTAINGITPRNDVEKVLSKKAPEKFFRMHGAELLQRPDQEGKKGSDGTTPNESSSLSSSSNTENATEVDTRLSLSGYSVSKSAVGHRTLSSLKEELTARPIVSDILGGGSATPNRPNRGDNPKQRMDATENNGASQVCFPLWMESKSRIYMPKYFGLSRYGPPKTTHTSDGSNIPHVKFEGTLRSEQEPPVKAFLSAVNNERELGGILSLPCASGKTVMALYILATIGKKTLIVVHKGFLLDQWKERIQEFLPAARIGMIKAQVLDVHDKDIVIGSLQSLSMKDYPVSVFQDFGFVIIDEVHRTGTEVFSRALKKINIKRSMGLSATIHRKDGMTKVFTWFVGRVVFEGEQRKEKVHAIVCRFQDNGVNPAAIRYREQPTICAGATEVPNTSRMVNNICSHRPRTEIICLFILATILDRNPCETRNHNSTGDLRDDPCYSHQSEADDAMRRRKKKRRVLVLSDRKSQLRNIAVVIAEMNQTLGLSEAEKITTGLYIGDMKQSELDESSKKDVVLATYGFASEGFDVPGLDVLVLASPKSDIQQSVGRILRQREQDRLRVPLVFDIVDTFSGVFEGQARKRKSFYKDNDFLVTTLSSDGCHINSGERYTRRTSGISPERFLGVVNFMGEDSSLRGELDGKEHQTAIYHESFDAILGAVKRHDNARNPEKKKAGSQPGRLCCHQSEDVEDEENGGNGGNGGNEGKNEASQKMAERKKNSDGNASEKIPPFAFVDLQE